MKTIIAFLLGMLEFRSDVTWSDPRGGYTWLDASYDRGRDFAHRLTFRRFEA